MGNLTEFFERNAYIPEYFLGDRVYGTWKGIPFVGSVSIDHLSISDMEPEVIIGVDLPIKYNGTTINYVSVKHKDLHTLEKM
jgi:hypothetical protein